MIGETVSHYRVLRELGAGGMGVVYEAEDTRLKRRVALKFLTEAHLAEPSACERFVHEARAASASNHPNICSVFEVDEHQGRPFMAMELLDGMTLGRRIDGRPLDTDTLLRWAIQITDALDSTHARGIFHRDIKPGNVFITSRDDAKILDFGLAKRDTRARPLDPGGETATGSPVLTASGATPGTVAYMSPEQALGKRLDARTDLFSLGIVLYEMATGRSPFGGDSAAEISNRILNETPPTPLRANPQLPQELGRVVLKCLEKDRELRYQSARELLADLRRVQRDRSVGDTNGRDPNAPRPPFRRRWLALGALVVAAGIGGWATWGRSRRPRAPLQIVPFTTDGGLKLTPRLSPDAERVAFAWTGTADDNWDIYVKQVGNATIPLRLTTDPANDWSPVWSPDGQQIAFLRQQEPGSNRYTIYAMPSLGGKEHRLVDLVGTSPPPTFSWSPDGRSLVVAEAPSGGGPSRIVQVDLATLAKTPLTSPPGKAGGDSSPEFSPDGQQVAFARSAVAWGLLDIWVQPLGAKEARQLTFGRYDYCCDLTWTTDGREIVFTTGPRLDPGRIYRVPVGGGTPELMVGMGEAVASPNARQGRLIFAQDRRHTPREIWRTPGRKAPPSERKPQRLIASSRDDSSPRYSPDGARIAFQSARGGVANIWVADADGTNAVPVTAHEVSAGSPRWSPDGRTIVYDCRESGNAEIYAVAVDGGGVPRRLTDSPSDDIVPSFSRDGRHVYFSSDRGGALDIWQVPAEGGPAVQVTRRGGYYGEESWDGRSLYFFKRANRAVWRMPVGGGEEVEVLRLPSGYANWTVAQTGIYYAVSRESLPWRRNLASVLFFEFQSNRAQEVFSEAGPFLPNFLSVSPDEAFIVRHRTQYPQSELMLVENFR